MLVAFYLPGHIPVYTFSLVIGLSATVGLAWIAWQAPEKQLRRHVDAGLWVLLGGLLGGRAVFVAASWDYYQVHRGQIPAVQLGGLSWPGALAGGLLALALTAALTRSSVGQLADALLPLLAALTVGAWLGCWLTGCAYGPTTDTGWGMPARDEWGSLSLRWPAQFLGALLALGWFGLLDWGRRGRGWFEKPGRTATLGILGLSLEMFGLSYLRADPTPLWHGLRLDAWGAAGFAGLAALMLVGSLFIQRKQGKGEGEELGVRS